MEPPKDAAEEDKAKGRPLQVAAIALAVILLIGIAFDLRSRNKPTEDKGLSSQGFGTWSTPPERPEAEVTASPQKSSLALTPSLAEDPELSFGDFMDALESEIGGPLVGDMGRRFAKAFLADPKLKAVYKEYALAEKEGQRRPAAKFVKQIRKMPEFRKLVNQFAGKCLSA